MKRLYDVTKTKVINPTKSALLFPIWTVIKLNYIKVIGIWLLFWTAPIIENYQHDNPDKIGNKIIIVFFFVVFFIACGFISKEMDK
jgi:hypothetical protein